MSLTKGLAFKWSQSCKVEIQGQLDAEQGNSNPKFCPLWKSVPMWSDTTLVTIRIHVKIYILRMGIPFWGAQEEKLPKGDFCPIFNELLSKLTKGGWRYKQKWGCSYADLPKLDGAQGWSRGQKLNRGIIKQARAQFNSHAFNFCCGGLSNSQTWGI